VTNGTVLHFKNGIAGQSGKIQASEHKLKAENASPPPRALPRFIPPPLLKFDSF
jgi:hypothetical protein